MHQNVTSALFSEIQAVHGQIVIPIQKAERYGAIAISTNEPDLIGTVDPEFDSIELAIEAIEPACLGESQMQSQLDSMELAIAP